MKQPFSVFVLAALMMGCQKNPTPPKQQTATTYLAGAVPNGNFTTRDCYWKNGKTNMLTKIEGGFGSKATSIKVTKGLVYVAGNADLRTLFYPVVWKNGVMSKPQLPASPGFTGMYGLASKIIIGK